MSDFDLSELKKHLQAMEPIDWGEVLRSLDCDLSAYSDQTDLTQGGHDDQR